MALWLAPLILLSGLPARAACPALDTWLDRAEQDIVAVRLSAAQESLAEAETALSCGPPATRAQLGRFWRAEGVLFAIQGDDDDAALSFEAANRVDPGVWTPAFGDDLAARARAAAPLPERPGTLALAPWDADYLGFLDGAPATFPAPAVAGLHLVQASRSPRPTDAAVEYGRIILVTDGADITLTTPFPRDAALLPEPAVRRGPAWNSVAMMGGGVALALAGGGLLWAADQRDADYPAAVEAYLDGQLSRTEALARVEDAHQAQVGLGIGGGALFAAGAGAAVVGVVRW